MGRIQELLSPTALLRALVIGFAVTLTVIAMVVVLSVKLLRDESAEAFNSAGATLRASQAREEIAELQVLLHDRVDDYLFSDEVTSLSLEQQRALVEELHRDDNGDPAPGTDMPLIPLALDEVIEAHSSSIFLGGAYTGITNTTLRSAGDNATVAFNRYVDDPTPGNLRLLFVSLDSVMDQLALEISLQQSQLAMHEESFLDRASDSTVVVLGIIGVSGFLFLVVSQRATSAVRRAMATSSREQVDLAVTSARLQFRNDQLNALYNVFSEITDTLSLDHVVKATLRESMNIMRADMATLRILRGNELVPVGAMVSSGQELTGIRSVELGVGPTGRTAKRGRTMRIEEGGEHMMSGQPSPNPATGPSPSEETRSAPMEAGIIVPLVVGARVVGTLACWSHAIGAFHDEDQRLLEMMASQVATAIAAVEATEMSERRAHQDALTSLPNRRQLEEDLDGALFKLSTDDRKAVIAMLDIDNFKLLNDHHGHYAGDLALKGISSVLKASVREQDFVYRFGGEEFVVVFTDTTLLDAGRLAERLRSAVKTLRLAGEKGEAIPPVSVSIGLSQLPDHSKDIRTLIDLADKAMYRAKTNGRDRIEVWMSDGATTEAA